MDTELTQDRLLSILLKLIGEHRGVSYLSAIMPLFQWPTPSCSNSSCIKDINEGLRPVAIDLLQPLPPSYKKSFMPEFRRQLLIDSLIVGKQYERLDCLGEKEKMMGLEIQQDYYRALMAKDSAYEGVLYVGVKTTGIFCRPTCPARKPKFENCEFFGSAQQALLASFRPCKRCRPLLHPHHTSELIQMLMETIEKNPEKRWKDKDFQALSIDASTARRQFKKRFGMTFIEYARAYRMGLAMKQIRAGDAIINAQLSTGYESGSGFRDAFSRIMGAAPSLSRDQAPLKATWVDTKLGPMLAIADDESLYLLEFVDRRGLEREIERLRKKTNRPIVPGLTDPIRSIERELAGYFDGAANGFKTPLCLLGSPFQKRVWEELRQIPMGETRSYAEIALAIGQPSAFRAVANANGANQMALVIPCHRVINANGELGGYGGGIARKKWLVNHEKQGRKK